MSIILNSSPGVCSTALKRRASSDDDDELSSKKSRSAYYVTLESESPLPTSEDDESIYTIQGDETEFVQDTSDTSTHTYDDSDDDISVQLEFEVASQSEEENPMLNPTSSSDPEDYVTMGVIAAIYNETDIGFADDSDDSRSTVDSEIGRADYWTCVQCTSKNNNPLFRYCEKCYKIRKNFFPPRPKRKKRRQQKENELIEFDLMKKKSEEILSHDSGVSSQDTKSSQESDDSKILDCMEKKDLDLVDASEMDKSETNSIGESKKQTIDEQSEKRDSVDSDEKMCITCTLNPKNGAFSHGSTLHVSCCYKCAIRIWRTNKHCPICNRKITNVQKIFYN